MKKFLSIAAAAAAVTFAGAANAQLAGTFNGGGATAPYNNVMDILVTGVNECDGGLGGPITIYENNAALQHGSTFQVACFNSAGAALTFNYDSQGGSWKGLGVFPNLFAKAQLDSGANVFQAVNPATCAATVAAVVPGTGVAVQFGASCTTVPMVANATGGLDFGFSDVETQMFLGSPMNQPVKTASLPNYNYSLGVANWGLDSAFSTDVNPANETATQVFGIVMGVGASSTLFNSMQADQIAAGTLPASCANVYSAACAPNITSSQYRSLVGSSSTHFLASASISQLFTAVWPSDLTVTIARRDQGSGTQATSNAYFLHQGCGNAAQQTPDVAAAYPLLSKTGYTIQYNSGTGNVTTQLALPGNSIGVASAEKDGSTMNSSTAGGWYLKLDGVYPSAANASVGLYNMVTEETVRILTTGNTTLYNDLVAASKAHTGVGIVPTSNNLAVTTWGPGLPTTGTLPTGSYYQNNGKNCGGWRSY